MRACSNKQTGSSARCTSRERERGKPVSCVLAVADQHITKRNEKILDLILIHRLNLGGSCSFQCNGPMGEGDTSVGDSEKIRGRCPTVI